MTTREIKVKGAREHNLRDVSLSVPRGQLVCFSGVSGSGKSSLAFDTLYAEGQRRYVESLSNYARQFMGQMPKPDVDMVSGLSPSISISQKSSGNNPRSTVGTITEIYDFLRVLFARVGTGYCPSCKTKITAQSRDAIAARILALPIDDTLWIMAPMIRRQKGEFKDLFEDLRRQGFTFARVDGETIRLADPPPLDRQYRHDVEAVIDRIDPDSRDRGRITEAVDLALKLGESSLFVSLTEANADQMAPVKKDILYSSKYSCADCGRSFTPPTPQLFSFNSPQGMCEACDGLGRLYTFVPDMLVPDDQLSIRSGAVKLLGKWGDIGRYRRHVYRGVADAIDEEMELQPGTMLEAKWCDLSDQCKHIWLWGLDDALEFTWRGGKTAKKYSGSFEGLIPELLERYRTSKNKMQLKQFEKVMDTINCPDCHGKRLNPQASAVSIRTGCPEFAEGDLDRTLPELSDLSIDKLYAFFSELVLGETDAKIAKEALKEIRERLGFLLGVGLNYLNLGRTAPTLSGGESQRIRLAGQIGSGLVGVLYILDEPSIGLHPRDNDRLLTTLERLRDAGNTLIVVEHDEDTMRAADQIVDFGPGPGVKGGEIVAIGSVQDVSKSAKSVTGQFLSGVRSIKAPETLRPIDKDTMLTIHGARFHNLKGVDASFPLGTVICVTGVSGSGKSSLVGGILEPLLRNELNGAEADVGDHDSVSGLEHLDKTIAIDQSPIGRTPRSNPATYVKVFDDIRNLFARLTEAKTRGYTASRFSFNVDGGRCEGCDGNGATKLEMDFLADIWVKCPVCQGRRYNRETLSVKFKGQSIADVLQMDVSQALDLFQNVPKIADKLQTLVDVGLEYLKLGQPSPTLSGGEAQRIKLSRELSKRETGKTLYVLDEPTTGLHFADIDMLLTVIQGLADRGNTIVIVEHNVDVIKTADWVIDMGPEGGEGGGMIVAEGRPEAIAKCAKSHSGAAIAKAMGIKRTSKKIVDTRREIVAASEKSRSHVVVEAANEHNLKSVDVEIPRDAMTVFCGPSGSGKSSLAMDTIYAEGQRRYVESLSSYARQFVGQVQKPRVERIEGLSPAVALEQKNLGHSPRSTVGTVTEIYDYIRVLMARLGKMHCPTCAIPVGTQTADQIVDKVMAMPEGTRALLTAPIDVKAGDSSKDTWQSLRASGYQRVRIDGVTVSLDSAPPLDPRKRQSVCVVVDRIKIQESDRSRISDSVEQTLSLGIGVLELVIADDERDEKEWIAKTHSQHLVCGDCGRSFNDLTPHHFSFNSGVGWCPQCEGLGTMTGTNPAALITSASKTLLEGAALLWPNVDEAVSMWMLRALARHTGIPIDIPYDELSVSQRRVLFRGCGSAWIEVRQSDTGEKKKAAKSKPNADATVLFRYQFKGFYPALEEASRLTPGLRGKLEQFTDEIDCAACDGSRLRAEAAAVRYRGHTTADLVHMPLDRLSAELKTWKLDKREKKIAGELIREIKSRVKFLLDVGLDYLKLHRGAATLSGGEAQRIRLAGQLGSGLCGVLYVLDEPTIGLHPRDNHKLLGAMHRLRDQGNTLLVVEHDHDVIAGSDYLCDFGPQAGRHGGRIVARGEPLGVVPREDSVTAGYIDGTATIPVPASRRPVIGANGNAYVNFLKVHGARENNLQSVNFELPLGVFTAITGPSGSGKSSLIEGILYPALARRLHRARLRPGRHDKIEGVRYIDKVIEVDQSPLGNSPSSNAATYTGAFDLIRQIFAELPESADRRFTARTFSFNVQGGRCDTCDGYGELCIEMHFLPDVYVPCDECNGRRYNESVLEVKLHGKSIADVLDLSCGEAYELFSGYPKLARILETLCDVGLEYVTLGQSAPTLSGGEAQRVKLAAELSRPMTGNTLYLLDEPTTGLHFDDIQKLLSVIQQLVDLGNTVVVIEHNLDVIKCADWIVDMGPGAGAEGGQIVFAGKPEDLAAKAKKRKRTGPVSATAPFLAKVLETKASETKTSRAKASGNQSSEKTQVAKKPTKKGASKTESKKKTSPSSPVNTATKKTGGDLSLDPWKVLGRKWHSLGKGFPENESPEWPLELVDRMLNLLEQVAGDDSLEFPAPDRVDVRPSGANDAWAEVETKTTGSLKVTLAGPADAIDLDQLTSLDMEGPVDLSDAEYAKVTLNLTEIKHVRSRKLKTFLKSHLARTVK